MEEPAEVQSGSPPETTRVHPLLSIWKRLRGFGLKRLFFVCVGIGAGMGIGAAATVASIAWLSSRPTPTRDWPRLDIEGMGLKAKLRTDWDNSVRYQLSVVPRSNDLKAAFTDAVREGRDSISFTVHLYDKAGFELCKKEVRPTPVVGNGGSIDGLQANDAFDYDCSRSNYKRTDHWNLSWVFPALNASVPSDGATALNERPSTDQTLIHQGQEMAARVTKEAERQMALARSFRDSLQQTPPQINNAKAKAATNPSPAAPQQENEPSEEDDTLTGFDLSSGHLETLSGSTFVVREVEMFVASVWVDRTEVLGEAQPRLHITCKTRSGCVIENTTNHQAVHGRKIR